MLWLQWDVLFHSKVSIEIASLFHFSLFINVVPCWIPVTLFRKILLLVFTFTNTYIHMSNGKVNYLVNENNMSVRGAEVTPAEGHHA